MKFSKVWHKIASLNISNTCIAQELQWQQSGTDLHSGDQKHTIFRVEHREDISVLFQILSLQPFLSFGFWCSAKLTGFHPFAYGTSQLLPSPLARGTVALRGRDVGCRSCPNKGEESNTLLTPEFPEHLTGGVNGNIIPHPVRAEPPGCFTIASHIPTKVWLIMLQEGHPSLLTSWKCTKDSLSY